MSGQRDQMPALFSFRILRGTATPGENGELACKIRAFLNFGFHGFRENSRISRVVFSENPLVGAWARHRPRRIVGEVYQWGFPNGTGARPPFVRFASS